MIMSQSMLFLCGIGRKLPCVTMHFFIASCINDALAHEICWLMPKEQVALGTQLHELPRCIGFIYNTLVEIWNPYNNEVHRTSSRLEDLFNEQHIYFGPSWTIHVHRWRLLWFYHM